MWAKRDIFVVGPEGELSELALLRSLTCRVRRMKSFICQSWATYCVFVGYVTLKIRASKRSYYRKKFDECKSNRRKTWKLINDENKQNIVKIEEGNREYTNSFDIAEKLNAYFSTINGERISDSCPGVDDNFANYLGGDYGDSFVFNQVTPNNIYKKISSLTNKPCHINVFHDRIYKFIVDIISPVFSVLVNRSITSGIFPDNLKKARVVPIFKGGDSSYMKNYRPISILQQSVKFWKRSCMFNFTNTSRKRTYFSPISLAFVLIEVLLSLARVFFSLSTLSWIKGRRCSPSL